MSSLNCPKYLLANVIYIFYLCDMKTIVQCLHPKFIRNPHMEKILMQSLKYITPEGEQVVSSREYALLKIGKHPYNPFQMRVTLDNIDQYQVIDEDGCLTPMFMAVPCRRCDLCLDKKKSQWTYRVMCETQFAEWPPYFVTLTYDNANLPRTEEGRPTLCKKDYQDFLKRLRIHLLRNGQYFGLTEEQLNNLNIRYVCCGEYGKQRNRPHYHLIIFGLPPMINIGFMNAYIRARWQKGIVRVLPVTQGCTGYVTKYMCKPSNYRLHCTQEPLFFEASRRPGIGSKWLDYFREWLLNHPGHPATCIDNFNGQVMTCQIPDFFKNKLFATYSRMINTRTAKYLSVYNLLASYLGQCLRENSMLMPLESKFLEANYDVERINKKFEDYGFIDYHFNNLFAFDLPSAVCDLSTKTYKFNPQNLADCISLFVRIQDWLFTSGSDISHVDVVSQLQKNLDRSIVVENYLRDLPEVNLFEKSDKIRRNNRKVLDREKI